MILHILIVILLSITIVLFIKRQLENRKTKKSIAFFHLYCSSGGGGERVLWHTVEALTKEYPDYTIYIYSHRNISDSSRIFQNVRDLFHINLNSSAPGRIQLIPLASSPLTEPKQYPYLTLLFQILGSIVVGCEAAYRLVPEVYIETMGFSYTLPIFKLHNCSVVTYVHYPTISNDMIRNVKTSSHASFNNREIFVKSPSLRMLKLFYYKLLAFLYGLSGRQADLVIVNSTWTQSHIESLWGVKAHVVHPPCDVESFKALGGKHTSDKKDIHIVSIAQFRPEKNHHIQIEAFDSFLEKTKLYESKLVLYGGCRDDEDKKRVAELRDLVSTLGLESNIDIIVSASFERLLDGLKDADVAIHTMHNEHFGIVLLECMAAGLITIAHNSGGPKTDIIDHGNDGFLADNVEEFTGHLVHITQMKHEDRKKISNNAIEKSNKFSCRSFENKIMPLLSQFI